MNKITGRRKDLIFAIDENISRCTIEDKEIVLSMIVSGGISTNKLQEDGTGTGVLYRVLSDHLIEEIYKFVIQAAEKTKLNLDFSDDDEE